MYLKTVPKKLNDANIPRVECHQYREPLYPSRSNQIELDKGSGAAQVTALNIREVPGFPGRQCQTQLCRRYTRVALL